MADERTAKAVFAGVWIAAVNDAAVEEEYIAGFQVRRRFLQTLGDGDVLGREELGAIGFFRADDVHAAAAGDDDHAAVFRIGVIDGEPGSHAGSRRDAQVKVVLVERLAARAR